MKKIIFILSFLLISAGLFGQSTFKYDVTILKTTPTLTLQGTAPLLNMIGTGAQIKLYTDVFLQRTSSNVLTITANTIKQGTDTLTTNAVARSLIGIGISGHKYTASVSLGAGVITQKTTTVTTAPYAIMLYDAADMPLSNDMVMKVDLVGGVYVLDIYSTDAITITLNIFY
jgi:hypothetical protein